MAQSDPSTRTGAPVHLHLGAHRTGSSAFQAFLGLNRDAIAAQGFDLVYAGRDGAPGGSLRMRLPGPRHGPKLIEKRAQQARENLANFVSDPSRPLILSEENILGRLIEFQAGLFYFNAAARAAYAVDKVIQRPVGSVLLVVRSYDEVLVSAFRKRAEMHDTGDFAGFRDTMMGFGGGWPEVITSLHAVLRPERFTVVPYSRPRSDAALAALLDPGLDVSGLQPVAKSVNASFSDAALWALQARFAAGEKPDASEIDTLRRELADIKAPRPFAAFSSADRATLRDRYAEDLQRLADLPGVDLRQA